MTAESPSTVSVQVKWQKKKYEVDVQVDAPAQLFKSQVRPRSTFEFETRDAPSDHGLRQA